MDPTRHMAKEDSKAGGEAPAADERDLSPSQLEIDHVAIEDNEFFTHVDSNIPQGKHDPANPQLCPQRWCQANRAC